MKDLPPLRSILDAFEEGVCLVDEASYVCCMNAAAEQLLGYTEKELQGGPFLPNVKIALLKDSPIRRRFRNQAN
ncbi:MAG: PAS domain-containing protein [Methylocystis sp.]|uniref:PAS domain-containing protein n=1 Tax=Methylocystis sp. TaxID=1911079 RepID=UPI003DA44EDE